MMFDTFNLSHEFKPQDKELYLLLKRLWNSKYNELYDEDYFEHDVIYETNLEEDIEILFDTFFKQNIDNDKMWIFLGQTLCLASFPYLKATLIDKQLEWFQECINCLETGGNFDKSKMSIIDGLPGSSSESAMVFFKMADLLNHESTKEAVLDMLDGCVEGSAICPGTLDKRAIFNWLLIDVFPSAYHMKRPNTIYTIDTVIPDTWIYNEAI